MSFWRHARSIGPMWVLASPKAEPECRLPLVGTEVWQKGAIEIAPLLIVRDESHRLFLGGLRSRRARLRFTGCVHFAMKEICRSTDFQRTANSGLTGCLRRGVHRKAFHTPWLLSVVFGTAVALTSRRKQCRSFNGYRRP